MAEQICYDILRMPVDTGLQSHPSGAEISGLGWSQAAGLALATACRVRRGLSATPVAPMESTRGFFAIQLEQCILHRRAAGVGGAERKEPEPPEPL